MHDEIPAPPPGRPPMRVTCPECDAPLAGTYERCPRCALLLRGPVAAELWRLDRDLAGLRAREAGLLARRAHLLGVLGSERARAGTAGPVAPASGPSPAAASGPGSGPRVGAVPGAGAEPGSGASSTAAAGPVPGPGFAAGPGDVPVPGPVPVPVPKKEVSPRAVQNLLLGLGGLLLVVAAVVFTVVSWGSMGIGGRAAVLAGVTGLAFAAPVPLVRRGLVTTAETMAMFGVALLFLDGYAARHTGLAGADELTGPHYAALLFTLVALAVAGYSRLLPLRLPLPVAVVVAQFPLSFLAFDESASWITAALAATAAADAAFLILTARRDPAPVPASTPRAGVRATVAVCFGVVWGLGVCHGILAVLLQQVLGDGLGDGVAASAAKGAVLVAMAVTGLAVARRVRHDGRLGVATAVSALTLTVGLAAPFRPLFPSAWEVVLYTLAALATVVVMLRAPGLDEPRLRSTGARSGAVLAAVTTLPFVDVVPFALLNRGQYARLDAAGNLGAAWPIASFPQFPVVAGLLALAATVAALRGRPLLGFAAIAAGTLTVAVAPVAFGWGHRVDLAVLSVLAVALVAALALATRPRWAWAFAVAAGTVSAEALAVGLATRTTTYVVLTVLLVAWGVAAYTARVRAVAALSLVAGVLSAIGLGWTFLSGFGWAAEGEGLSLALAAGAVLAALLVLPALMPSALPPSATSPSATSPSATSPSATSPSATSPSTTPASAASVDDPRRLTGLVLSGTLALLAVLTATPALIAIGRFHRPLLRPWTAPAWPGVVHPVLAAVVVLTATAAVLVSWQMARRPGAVRTALLAWPLVLVSLPVSVALPYGTEVAMFVAGVVPPAWAAARSRAAWAFGGVAATWAAFVAISWALASETATLVVLPVLAVVAAAVALRGRAAGVAPVAAGLATLLAGGEALAAGLAPDWPVRYAAFGPLAVACAAAVLAGRFRRSPFAAGVEAAGYALVGVGLPLASADLPTASLACAVAGVLMAGTALRPDRRRWAGYVGTGFLLAASWLRLLASDVTVVEAYTVPFSVVLLVIGLLRARRGPTSSWVAYGPGLASSLLPSLLALLGGSGTLRPLLLGVAALAVLLAGARFRSQAPVVLGGLTLAAVALHELTPWVAQLAALVPRWVPMALGGLLLVAVGATYEARLRDVRRLRAAVGRMR
ncbi:SCO7613 C-terminal domain-containing membrane protein [Streptosporangium sp. NPDC050855]|uniref:SCO7613 C-terminal domain-containing membrane protein n=1 Tax=Streptosporangium sp. NPDC050855 TaxID=3366194 RepID=UPI00378E8221